MVDMQSIVAASAAATVLMATLLWFVIIPKIRQWHRRIVHRKIVRLIKELPTPSHDGKSYIDAIATVKLTVIYWRHPEWVDAGFTEIRQSITDAREFSEHMRVNAAFHGIANYTAPKTSTT